MMNRALYSFLDLVHLQAEMNKLFEILSGLQVDEELPKEMGTPTPYDVLEMPEYVLIKVDLPGVDRDSISIQAAESTITIEGEKKRSDDHGIVAYHLMERERGAFQCRVKAEGSFDTHKATSRYEHGVLTIFLPRLAERRGNVVQIPLLS